MEVMNHIEQIFVNLRLMNGLKNHMVEVIVTVKVIGTTRMKNNQSGLISELNPRRCSLPGLPREY
jgi:hypothetical protein